MSDFLKEFQKALEAQARNTKDVEVNRSKEVKQIVVPDSMTLQEASEWLTKKMEQEETFVNFSYELPCFPLDGALALSKALAEIYGFTLGVSVPGFFSMQKPTMVGVPISMTETKHVFWGRMEIPGFEGGYVQTGLSITKNGMFFVMFGMVKQRDLPQVEKIHEATKKFLASESIYKGKAVKLNLKWTRSSDPADEFDVTSDSPQFVINTDAVKAEELIFSVEVQRDIELGLFTLIENADECRQHGIPMKRGVLLAGPYGVGKTLTAYVTAKKCVENGFTFIYLDNVEDLASALQFAKSYSPAVVFAEDVDRVIGTQNRTVEIDKILNTIDGIDTKSSEIITVLTTNHLENISQAMLRPGRIDTLVNVTRPDAYAAGQLVKIYSRGLLNPDADIVVIGKSLAGYLPVEIRETVERAKLAAISRMSRSGELKTHGTINGFVMEDDIIGAVHAMKEQHRLLEPKTKDTRTPVEKAAELLGFAIGDKLANVSQQNCKAMLNTMQMIGFQSENLNKTIADECNDIVLQN